MTTYSGNSWALTLAPGWTARSEEDAEVLYHPEGAGALRISAARKEDPVTDEDLQGFAARHPDEGAHMEAVECGEFRGYRYEIEGDSVLVCQWFLRAGTLALFLTYNCSLEHKCEDDEALSAMLGTLSRLED
ncbi:MAG: hypothetical protein P8172_07780 [Gammaproteobacteria bacterium]|jgi:hypothetical protein